jgi:WD40 repeat protein
MWMFQAAREPIHTVAYSPDSQLLAAGSNAGHMVAVQRGSPQPIFSFRQEDSIRGLAFHPQGNRLAIAVWNGTVWEYALRSRQKRAILDGLPGGSWGVAYNFAGEIYGTSGDGGLHRLQRRTKQTVIHRLHQRPILGLALSADGRLLATASLDRSLMVWDAYWFTREQTFLHQDWVCSAAFSPDGHRLVSSEADGTLVVSMLMDARPAVRWNPGSAMPQVRFVPQRGSFLSAGWDGTVREWDLATQQELSALSWSEGRLLSLAVAPDGMTAAVGCESGKVVMWDLD